MIKKGVQTIGGVYKGNTVIGSIYKGIALVWQLVQNWKTVTGNPATFSDGADNEPIKSLKASIEPVQSGSGDPSPSNIRPISGWTGATVQRSGKNLFDASTITDGHYLDINGNVQISPYWNYSDYIEISSNWQVTISGYAAIGTAPHSCWYDKNKNFISSFQLSATSTTVTPPQNAKYLRISAQTRYKEEVQVEYGSTATAYEPYKPIIVVPVSWQSAAGTVYGGVVDVISGQLTVTHGEIASYDGETIPGEWMSDRDVYAAGTTPTMGAQVVYELATPITYQLTPQEVRTLLGNNVIGADCGPVEVTYQYVPE